MSPKAHVLIVDDQPTNVHVLAEALGNDYELLVATTAARAFELASKADLILLDVIMPDMDGRDVCRRLKGEDATRPIPIIFVTALEQTEDEAEGFAAGAVDYIVKPINPAIVRARVRTHLELKAARDLLERLAKVDALTGIANRRRFDEAADEEWRRCMRNSQVLTLAIADIDHFKAFNDKHGHGGGDACLRRVAQALNRLARRPGELVARYGGEEFAFLLPDVDPDGARQFVIRALGAVLAVEIEGLALPGQVGLSVGSVTLIPSPLRSAEEALRVADEGLYKAKQAGRRRGVVCDLETGVSSTVLPDF